MAANTSSFLPGLMRGHSNSSAIRDAVYFGDRGELRITFASGRTFAYSDVPQSLYQAFLASPSKGAFFNIAIRGRFQFREVAPPAHPTRH